MDNDKVGESSETINEGTDPRFNNHLKSNLIHIHKNLYLNRNDPLYYEKILRYSDPKSSEAHFMLAQKYEKEGTPSKALFHYQEAASEITSPFYTKARENINRLQNSRSRVEPATISFPPNTTVMTQKISPLRLYLPIGILLFSLALLFSLLNMDTIRAMISSVKHWTVGMEVVYETVDIPYVMYLSNDQPTDKIEKILYSKAAEMGKQKPKQNIQLYGIMTSDPTLIGKTLPLSSEKLKESAFVIAQYNASVDKSVKIQFQNIEFRKLKEGIPPLTGAASNLVRTALQTYINDNKSPPNNIESLVTNYPNNYLSFIPNEVQSGSNQVVSKFDGTGGWVYHPSAKELSSMFYPNTSDELSALEIPYLPVKIIISKHEYALKVITGSIVLASKSVGLGKQDRTPEGSFTIQDRVLNPLGKNPNVYGEAGLSMGHYAIHGTNDETSVRANQSLGCIRLSNLDILDIFPLTPKGAAVQISFEFPSDDQNSLVFDPRNLFPSQKPQIIQSSQNIIFNWLG